MACTEEDDEKRKSCIVHFHVCAVEINSAAIAATFLRGLVFPSSSSSSTNINFSAPTTPLLGSLLLFPDNKNCLIYDYVRRIRKEFRSDLQTGQVRSPHCTHPLAYTIIHPPASSSWIDTPFGTTTPTPTPSFGVEVEANYDPPLLVVAPWNFGLTAESVLSNGTKKTRPVQSIQSRRWFGEVGKKMSLSGHVCRIIVFNKRPLYELTGTGSRSRTTWEKRTQTDSAIKMISSGGVLVVGGGGNLMPWTLPWMDTPRQRCLTEYKNEWMTGRLAQLKNEEATTTNNQPTNGRWQCVEEGRLVGRLD